MRRAILAAGAALGLAALLPLSCCAALTPGQEAAAAVTRRIEARECAGAVDELKSGLKRGFGEVSLLAGTMYEHAVCVQRDWNRAVLFYSQAYVNGVREAADRMAAGYAAPENGADVAAAIWWAGKGRIKASPGLQTLAPCAVDAAAADDMDRFVAELQTWPQWRLAMCNYVVGVMSTLSAEIKYPALAQAYGVGGEVTLRFLPAVPKIDMKRGDTQEYQLLGIVNGDVLRDRGASMVTGAFEKAIGTVAERALRRYPQPSGIPAEAVFYVRWIFKLD
ncbi:hypothetical protein [Massilia sp. Bi118]|uniref:hypothetical protein n=1 Tax=Massilia sp. Bi118 TaxID=2822346 RepID=UPI001E5D225C|nr:hypothetical protein [Massilia sp. Bi118]